jgi:Na+-translocating ferredoxin:NAD+ oxidoreductase subunit C
LKRQQKYSNSVIIYNQIVIKTFRYGGTHPPDTKITAGRKIESLPLPAVVTIPLSQHAGAPAIPLVAKGDRVLVGQLIARSSGKISANIHSSVSGTVSKIETTMDSSGYKQLSIRIDVSGDEWIDTIDRASELKTRIDLSANEIIEKCHEAGIVGLGGAGFPTHVKLKLPPGKRCNLLVINAAECEPYLTSDHSLMLEKGMEILTGTSIMMKALDAPEAMIGIESNKPDAIEYLTSLCNKVKAISVVPLQVKYPQGGEKQLIKTLINREVPHGGLPIDVGVVVQNVATAFAIYEAVQKNKPVFERVVTVTGKSLANPSNFMTRIGTPVQNLIDAAGGLPEDTGKIINGGPMMGRSLNSLEIPVVKSMSGIVVLPEKESVRRNEDQCIRCSKCVTVCALKLEPYLLMALAKKGFFERAEQERITDCCECGSCSFICPASRHLLDYIKHGKATVLKMKKERDIIKNPAA